MGEIRKLDTADADIFVRIVAQAYPGINLFSEEARNRFRDRAIQTIKEDAISDFYGYFRDGQLMGGMKCYDYRMNLYGQKIFAGGVGLVAVDLLHKKEQIAKQLISFFLRHYREAGASITLLYPFRVDFYKQMGFGLGNKIHQYRVTPESLPKIGLKQHIVYLSRADRDELVECYSRYAQKTHGMIDKNEYECKNLFDNPENVLVGYKRDGKLQGYLAFSFKRANDENYLINNILVKEMVYETREALLGMLAFLRSQADQVHRILFHTQDESFHYLLRDPRNGSDNILPHVSHESNTSAVGLMYRVINVPLLFEQLAERNFQGLSCKVKLTVTDSFLPENAGSYTIQFQKGRPVLTADDDHDVELSMDISDFSSLIMGAVPLKSLYLYGLAEISDPDRLDELDRLFCAEAKPKCTTPF